MAGISHFQRYSQKENHVTNNTLLVLRHLYQTAPSKLEEVIGDIVGEPISLGVTFQQQTRGSDSVPDGLIAQNPFSLFFETKLGASLDHDQLIRHVRSIANERKSPAGHAYLVGLSTQAMPLKELEGLAAMAKAEGIIFAATTFAELVTSLNKVCFPHEVALQAIVEDFSDFLASENLLFHSDEWMLVVPCGATLSENHKFGIYYDGTDRPKRSPCAFIGAYKNKSIRLVGRITSVLVCRYFDGKVTVLERERGSPSADAIKRITAIIEATTTFDLKAHDQRYYVVDEFITTNLVKQDKGPVRGAQYLQISSLLPDGAFELGLSSRELAGRLEGRYFGR